MDLLSMSFLFMTAIKKKKVKTVLLWCHLFPKIIVVLLHAVSLFLLGFTFSAKQWPEIKTSKRTKSTV